MGGIEGRAEGEGNAVEGSVVTEDGDMAQGTWL